MLKAMQISTIPEALHILWLLYKLSDRKYKRVKLSPMPGRRKGYNGRDPNILNCSTRGEV
jgi:hypothetical protein